MTASTHDEDFNALARLKPVRKAVCRFSKNPSEDDQIKIKHCMDPTKFGIQSAPLTFVDKCHGHHCGRDRGEKRLTIGSCE